MTDILVPSVWIEQTVTGYKAVGLPLTDEGEILGWPMRFELTLDGFTIRSTTFMLQSPLTGLGCKNRTCASCSQSTNDTISPIRVFNTFGLGGRIRTASWSFGDSCAAVDTTPSIWLRDLDSNQDLKLMRLLNYPYSIPQWIGWPIRDRTWLTRINSPAAHLCAFRSIIWWRIRDLNPSEYPHCKCGDHPKQSHSPKVVGAQRIELWFTG